jgi:GTP-binding protein
MWKIFIINKMIAARVWRASPKTQTLNFYKIEEQLFFVDVPGYGYAKVSKSEREAWWKMIETYITSRELLRAVIQIVDLRHPPSDDDCMMYDFLKYHNIPCIVIATKADKIPKGKWEKHKKMVREELDMEAHDTMILFSSETGLGFDAAWAEIKRRMVIETE